jgi:hypothetical protein
MRIAKEKQSASGAFDDAKVVCDGDSNDAKDTERVKVSFRCMCCWVM